MPADDDLDFSATIRGMVPGQSVFGRYTLQKILGRGGMGVVWLARDEDLERDVALKFLPEVVAGDKQAVKDLKRETRRSLDLTHSNIVRIYDFVQDERSAAISMEYVAGDTLASLKVDQPHSHYEVAQLEKWVQQLCEALSYAHEKAKVVHRDLKPANLMVDAEGDLKIADFGIAASVSDSVSQVSMQAGTSGTPVYMGPQQMMGEKPAVTDDIYSLGATLYDLLVSRPPFFSGNVMMQVMNKAPLGLQEARVHHEVEGDSISANWAAAILSCLAKEAVDRPQSVAEFQSQLSGQGGSHKEAQKDTKTGGQHDESHRDHGGDTEVTEPGVEKKVASNPAQGGQAPAARDATASGKENPKSKIPAMLGIAAAAAVIVAAGWWFGLEQPKRQEAARMLQQQEVERRAEATKLESERQRMMAAQSAEATRLAAVRIPVEVLSEPTGASVWMDGREVGITPWSNPGGLALGDYDIELRLEDYDPQVNALTIKEQGASRWSFDLVRSSGTINWDVQPGNAKFRLQDEGPADVEGVVADAEGMVSDGPITLPTGTYWGTISNPARLQGLELVDYIKVEVTRDVVSTVTADVRSGRVVLNRNVPDDLGYELSLVTEDGNGLAALDYNESGMPGKFELSPGDYHLWYERSGHGLHGSELFSIQPGETTILELDLLGPSLVIVPPPGGQVIDQNGNVVSDGSEYRIDDLPFATKLTYGVRKEGFFSQFKEFNFSVEDRSERRSAERWTPELEEQPPFLLSANARHGPTQVRVSMESDGTSSSRTTNKGSEMFSSDPTAVKVAQDEVVSIHGWSRSGEVTEMSTTKAEESMGMKIYKPNSVVRFSRTGSRWSARFTRGGYVHDSIKVDTIESPFYPGAWLNEVTLPTQSPQVGASWNVPLSQSRLLMPWMKINDPAGSIEAKITRTGLADSEPWAEVEYRFNFQGAMDTGTPEMTMTGDCRGVLRMKVDLTRGYVRSGSVDQHFSVIAVNGDIRSENTSDSKITFSVTPLQWANAGEPTMSATGISNLDDFTAAEPIVKIAPVYPRRALQRGVTGHTIVEFEVTANGVVNNPRIIEAEPSGIFDDASLKAVQKFKFKPAMKNGQPVSSTAQNKFSFELED